MINPSDFSLFHFVLYRRRVFIRIDTVEAEAVLCGDMTKNINLNGVASAK